VIIAFECGVVGGALRGESEETLEARFWTHDEAAALPLTPWLRPVLAMFFDGRGGAYFHPPQRFPPA
jgi:hypothetical protein